MILDHSTSALQSLSDLVSLQHLSLKWGCKAPYGSVDWQYVMPPDMLATLSNLTHVTWSDQKGHRQQVLKALPMLLQLVVKSNKVTAAALAALLSPNWLQHLKLASATLDVSTRTLPQLPHFTALQSLKFGPCTRAAEALAGMTQLQLIEASLQDAAALLHILQSCSGCSTCASGHAHCHLQQQHTALIAPLQPAHWSLVASYHQQHGSTCFLQTRS